MMRLTLLFGFLVAFLVAPPVAPAEQVDEAEQDEIVERILELRGQLEELMATLPEGLRDEVERRWRERGIALETAELEAEPPEVEDMVTLTEAPVAEETQEQHRAVEPEEVATTEKAPSDTQSSCGDLSAFDTNGDGAISGGDRYWRYLSLWFDNGDGVVDPGELRSLFELEIRRFSTGLDLYWTRKETDGDIVVESFVEFLLLDKKSGRGLLVIDTDRISRGGEVRLLDASGMTLSGLQPLIFGVALEEVAEAQRTQLLCAFD